MRKFLFISLITAASSICSSAQVIHDGLPMDSSMIRFNGSVPTNYIPDTSASPLWQIGLTHKAFFATDTAGTFAMMTDTTNVYPANANNYFVVKIPLGFNTIVDVWHKYQTDSFHAGGIVEFSLDSGTTWQNVKGDCNVDSGFGFQGVLTSNFYTFADTLFNGQPAFMDSSVGERYSRVQFFVGYPVKTTSTTGCYFGGVLAYIRFRFVSDTTVDSLAGWMIDSMKIEQDYYGGYVKDIHNPKSLHVFPNPSYDGVFMFPALDGEKSFNIDVYNTVGKQILNTPYRHEVLLSDQPPGLYFYRVTDGINTYRGQLLRE